MANQPQFDVFLCHNSEDKDEVKEIGEQLRAKGILPWLDEWELRPGIPWQRLLEQQIEQIKSAAVFIGSTGLGPWQEEEIYAFLRQFVKRKCPVIPVLLPYAPEKPQLPPFLEAYTWVDFRRLAPNPIERLIWGITGQKPAPENKIVSLSGNTLTPLSHTKTIEVFISYAPNAPNDEKLLIELEKSLSVLEEVKIWHKGKIRAGQNPKVESEKHLNSARIILLLISEHFIASDDHRNNEGKQAIARQKAGKALVIPVLLSPVALWQKVRVGELQLGELQPLPKNGKFVTGRGWKNQREAFFTIAEELAEEVARLAAESL